MRRLLAISLMVLASCGQIEVVEGPPAVPADLLQPVNGWTGPTPRTNGELMQAALAEKAGREGANAKLAAIAEIVGR